MLHIILLILKIIGIILLSILGLFVFAVICVLFVPVRYKGKGEWYKEKQGKIVISWLLHIVSLCLSYDNGETQVVFRIFGIRLRRRKKKTKKAKKAKKVKKHKMSKQKAKKEKDETVKVPVEKELIQQPQIITLTEVRNKSVETKLDKEAGNNTKKRKLPNPFELFRKIRFKIKSIYDKLKKINEKKNNLLAFLRNEETKSAWKYGKKEIIKLIKYILPTKIKLYAKFGFEDPSTTGKVLGIIYTFYGFTKKFQIYPDFENVVFEGETNFKGRIRGIRLLIVFLKLWRNQQIKNTIERAKQI